MESMETTTEKVPTGWGWSPWSKETGTVFITVNQFFFEEWGAAYIRNHKERLYKDKWFDQKYMFLGCYVKVTVVT